MAADAKPPLGLVLTVLAVQLAVAFVVAHAWVASRNTLYNNGRWTSTKTTLAGGIIGAQSFVFDRQALARDRLNLSAWFGYQEVVSVAEHDPASIEFLFSIAGDAQLTVQFGRGTDRYTGLLLSAAEHVPPALVLATNRGEFLRRREVRQFRRVRPGKVHRMRVEFGPEGDRGFEVWLNDRKLKTFRQPVARPMRIGFRGSARMAFVDEVRVVERGGEVFSESFARPAGWRLVYLAALLGTPLASALLFLVLRARVGGGDKQLLFFFLMFSLLLLAAAALYTTLVWRQAEYYPNRSLQLERREAAYAEAGSERMVERIESGYARRPDAGVSRILFVGSSQTRGSGAQADADTLDRQAARLLNERGAAGRYECLNVAVRAYDLARMRADLEQRWLEWQPALVVLNAGYNDRRTRTEDWSRELRGLISAVRAAGAELVIVPEASAPALPSPNLRRIHDATRRIARRAGVPLIEMHAYLQTRVNDGHLWWDWVHLTSFGQRAFAEHLVAELIRRELLQATASPDDSGNPAGGGPSAGTPGTAARSWGR